MDQVQCEYNDYEKISEAMILVFEDNKAEFEAEPLCRLIYKIVNSGEREMLAKHIKKSFQQICDNLGLEIKKCANKCERQFLINEVRERVFQFFCRGQHISKTVFLFG